MAATQHILYRRTKAKSIGHTPAKDMTHCVPWEMPVNEAKDAMRVKQFATVDFRLLVP